MALVLVLAGVGMVLGEEEEEAMAPSARPAGEAITRADVARIARGVERIRELEFERLPELDRVSVDEARTAVLEEFDRSFTPSRRAGVERLLELLGLLPAGAGLRETFARAAQTQLAGYYVPRTGALALVEGQGLEGVLGEVTLAHELVHALEDQRFGLDDRQARLLRDRDGADAALHEGTATVAMVDYLLAERGVREPPPDLRARVLEQIAEVAIPSASGLPRYFREGLVFPYARGSVLVNRVRGEGGWAAVDRAFGDRPLLSSEQVLHPVKYEQGERPVPMRLPRLRGALPAGARPRLRGDLGEFDTDQFLREANGEELSAAAAAGWGGSAFELWGLPGGDDLLALAWTWDSERDATAFVAVARRAVFALDAGGVVVRAGPRRVAVVLGPARPAARVAGLLARRAGS